MNAAQQIWKAYQAKGATNSAIEMLALEILNDDDYFHSFLDDYEAHSEYMDEARAEFENEVANTEIEISNKYNVQELTQDLFNAIVKDFEEVYGFITPRACFDISYDLNDLFNLNLVEQCFIS